jgi:hypothetical protein
VFAVCVWKFYFARYGPVNLAHIFNFSFNFCWVCDPYGIKGGATYWHYDKLIALKQPQNYSLGPYVLKNVYFVVSNGNSLASG